MYFSTYNTVLVGFCMFCSKAGMPSPGLFYSVETHDAPRVRCGLSVLNTDGVGM